MNTYRVFIGGLSYHTSKATLQTECERFAAVDEISMPVDAAGYPRGFALVSCPCPEEAEKLLCGLHGVRLDGRTLAPSPRGRNHERPDAQNFRWPPAAQRDRLGTD